MLQILCAFAHKNWRHGVGLQLVKVTKACNGAQTSKLHTSHVCVLCNVTSIAQCSMKTNVVHAAVAVNAVADDGR